MLSAVGSGGLWRPVTPVLLPCVGMPAEHESVLVDGVPIDIEIAPLIEALWARGIDTLNSCQDNTEDLYVWIEFASPVDASAFLTAVVGRASGWRSLYRRALREVDVPGGEWRYNLHPTNRGVEFVIEGDEVREHRVGPNAIDFSISIRFPRTDLATVLERLLASPPLDLQGPRPHSQ